MTVSNKKGIWESAFLRHQFSNLNSDLNGAPERATEIFTSLLPMKQIWPNLLPVHQTVSQWVNREEICAPRSRPIGSARCVINHGKMCPSHMLLFC